MFGLSISLETFMIHVNTPPLLIHCLIEGNDHAFFQASYAELRFLVGIDSSFVALDV